MADTIHDVKIDPRNLDILISINGALVPRAQATVDRDGAPTTIVTTGRHDPCLLPRFVPVAEAMVALVLADHWLRQRAIRG